MTSRRLKKQVARSLSVNTVIYSINVQQKYVQRIRSICHFDVIYSYTKR
jgi:hypothetical protein